MDCLYFVSIDLTVYQEFMFNERELIFSTADKYVATKQLRRTASLLQVNDNCQTTF